MWTMQECSDVAARGSEKDRDMLSVPGGVERERETERQRGILNDVSEMKTARNSKSVVDVKAVGMTTP